MNITKKIKIGVRSSRRPAISATTKSATRVDQLGDNLFPAFHYRYIFMAIIYRHIYFGTSVVQRYHKFCDPIHSIPHGAATYLPDGPSKSPNTVSVS